MIGRKRHGGARIGLVLLLSSLMGCGPKETLFHGVAPSADATYFDLASLMPGCGCVTMRNIASMPVEMVGTHHVTEVGALVMTPGAETRFGFDWAGGANDDTYSVEAYPLEPDGKGGMRRGAKPLVPVTDYLLPTWETQTDCKRMDCPFGAMGMNRMVHASTAGGQAIDRRFGVDYTAGGSQIAAKSTANSCGCMVMSNISLDKAAVTVRASLHSRSTGVMELPWEDGADRQPLVLVGFDWAGAEEEDRYLLTAVDRATRQLRVQDFVHIVGQMDQLECSAEGAVLRLPAPPGAEVTTQSTVTCPFGRLAMNEQFSKPAPATKGPQP